MTKTNDIGIVVLAAGASTRFGSPKQLAKFRGVTLIERISKTALSTGFETVVVLGANSDKARKAIEKLPVKIVVNNEWKKGLSSSIKSGLAKLLDLNPNLSGIILVLADQPLLREKTFLRLVQVQKKTLKPIVVCRYSDTIGTPALFMRNMFSELVKLKGDQGAKKLIVDKKELLATINAEEAKVDIDTETDLVNALNL